MNTFKDILGPYDRGEDGAEQAFQALRIEMAYLQKRINYVENKRIKEKKQLMAITSLGSIVLYIVMSFFFGGILPSSASDWMMASIFGGSPWSAGETLMRRADTATFDKMSRLYKACEKRSVEVCEAAMASRLPTL